MEEKVRSILGIAGIQILSNEREWDAMMRYESEALKLYGMIDRKVEDDELAKFIENVGLLTGISF